MPPVSTPSEFGRTVRAACEARGLSMVDLAAFLGVNPSRVFRLLREEQPGADSVARLSEVLEIDLSRFARPFDPFPTEDREITLFGKRIIEACNDRQITLADLGRRLQVSKARVYQIVRTGQPERLSVERVAAALGVDRSTLDPNLSSQE